MKLPKRQKSGSESTRGIEMPIEFLHRRPLESDELAMIRMQIESGFDTIGAIDPEVREIVKRNAAPVGKAAARRRLTLVLRKAP